MVKNHFSYQVSEEKKQRFQDAIFEEVNKQIDKLDKEIETYRDSALKKAKEGLLDQLFINMQEEIHKIKSDSKKQVTKANLESYRQLLLYRQSLENKVFKAVTDKLLNFVSSSAYRDFLISKITKCKNRYLLTDCTVYLRPSDMKFEKDVQKIFNNKCEIKENPENILGGFQITNKIDNIMIDELLETKLEEQREWFYKNSNLSI